MNEQTLFRRHYLGLNRYCAWPALHVRIAVDTALAEPPALLAVVEAVLDAGWRQTPAMTTWLAQAAAPAPAPAALAVARLALTLQNLAGAELDPVRALARSGEAGIDLLCGYECEAVSAAALDLALRLAAPRAGTGLPALARTLTHFLEVAPRLALDQTGAALLRAARRRGIPGHRLSAASRVVRLGQGRHQQRILETVSAGTPAVAASLVRNKAATRDLLAGLGIPMPEQVRAGDVRQARAAAELLGYPLTVKPNFSDKGRGVTPAVADERALHGAFEHALATGAREVLVERHVAGEEYRLLVVGGRLVAAARRIPAAVTGDGRTTVAGLVEAINADPRRGTDFSRVLERIVLDDAARAVLAAQGYAPESVPPPGVTVYLRRTANISTGGTAEDVTEQVHPGVVAMAEAAAQAVGLDVAGVDYLATDIGTAPARSGGAVVEINASPGLRPHWAADGGRRDVTAPILDLLFPPRAPARIPIVAVTGSYGKTTTCRLLQHVLSRHGHTTGLVCTDGMYIDGHRVRSGDLSGGPACEALLNHPAIDAAVMETARGGLARAGIGYGACDVGVMLNVDDEHLGTDGIDTLDEMAELKGLVLRSATRAVVVNAADPRCREQAATRSASCTCILFGDEAAASVLAAARADGASTVEVAVRDGERVIVLSDAAGAHVLMPLADVALLDGGRRAHDLTSVLAACAAARALEVPDATLSAALRGFLTAGTGNPGRLSVHTHHGRTAVIDMPKGVAGVQAQTALLARLAGAGRRILAMMVGGNRSDSQFAAMGAAAAPHFDHFVLFDHFDLRGRAPGEVPALLAAALAGAGVDRARIEVCPDPPAGWARALESSAPGDVVLLYWLDGGAPRDALVALIEGGPPYSAEACRAACGGG